MDAPASQEILGFFNHSNPIFMISIAVSALVATLAYGLDFGAVIRKELKRRRMKQQLDTLKDHYILCGFGRVGQQVARELSAEKEQFVIIDREDTKLVLAKDEKWPHLVGDMAIDETLFQKAHIERAKGVIISVGTDADTIFAAISARALNPDVFIVARASSKEAADKLTKVGANRVAMPYQIGGYHMATMAMRPSVVDFLDLLIDQERDEIEMEEFVIVAEGAFEGKTLEEAAIIREHVAVLAIRRKDGKAIINPNPDTKLHGGDRIVVMGPEAKLAELGKMITKTQGKAPLDTPPAPTIKIASDITPTNTKS